MKSFEQQTGWIRTHPQQICQDYYQLIKVTEYDFDLKNKAFKQYIIDRGKLHLAGPHCATKKEFFKKHRFAQEYKGSIYRFTDKEMDIGWEIMLSAKGCMQNLWEMFNAESSV